MPVRRRRDPLDRQILGAYRAAPARPVNRAELREKIARALASEGRSDQGWPGDDDAQDEAERAYWYCCADCVLDVLDAEGLI